MAATFKILQSVGDGKGGEFLPGELRSADEFQRGADFHRLVEIGAVRPTGLMAAKDDPRIELLDQIEELQQKLDKLGADQEDATAAHAETTQAKDAEIVTLKDQLAKALLDNESLGAELAKLKEPQEPATDPKAGKKNGR